MLHAHEKRVRLTVSARRCCPVADDAFIHTSSTCPMRNHRWVRVSSAAEQTSGRRAARLTKVQSVYLIPPDQSRQPLCAVAVLSLLAVDACCRRLLSLLLHARGGGERRGGDGIAHETPSPCPMSLQLAGRLPESKAGPGILPSAGSHVLSVTASFLHGRLRGLRKARAAFPTDRSSRPHCDTVSCLRK